MRGEIAAFVDTNVLVYALSTDDPRKQERASSIVARGFNEGCYAVSTQVLPFLRMLFRSAVPDLRHLA